MVVRMSPCDGGETEFRSVLRPSPKASLDRTASCGVAVSRKGSPKASLDRTRAAPRHILPNRFTHSLRSFVHPPTEQVLSSPHSVTSFPCEDTVRASSDKPSFTPFTKTSHDVCSWPPRCSGTLASARRGGGRERLHAATRGKAGNKTSRRTHSLQPTHLTTGHINTKHPKGKGWQTTSLRIHSLQPTQPPGTPTLHAEPNTTNVTTRTVERV